MRKVYFISVFLLVTYVCVQSVSAQAQDDGPTPLVIGGATLDVYHSPDMTPPEDPRVVLLNHFYGGNVLIAHAKWLGRVFYTLEVGEAVTLDGQVYKVVAVDKYRVLYPTPSGETWINLQDGSTFDWQGAVDKHFANPSVLTLYTCLWEGDNGSWGRTLWTATPIQLSSKVYLPTILN